MSEDKEIAALVAILKKFKPGNPLKQFITHVRFPKFKNLEPDIRIDFSFPVTALVGANGIGKSSVLHALWGMPFGYTTSRFWFATELDPIEGTQKNPQRYIYGHWNESYKGVVETRKARIGSKRDYWEPYRWSKADGMEPVPEKDYEGKSKDRWNPVKRSVVYINLKTAFGSFDRYFHFDSGLKSGAKRRVMLREARRLKSIIEGNRTSYSLGGRERLFENRMLNEDELSSVSKVLGREYDSARLIRHSLYPGNRGQDLSVLFRRGMEYSEAFAGSGEVAAVSAVVDILSASPYSLILLDEPETSLHPGAQRALLRFILEQVKLHKHQVIISTHSAEFLEGLPHDAIKVFEDNGKQQTRVLATCSPFVALHRLGKPAAEKRRILVEDPLAELLVLQAAKGLDPGEAKSFEVKVAPGGAESIIKYHGPGAMATGDDLYVLLDGDQKRGPEITDPLGIPPAEHGKLREILKKDLGCEPKFLLAGGDDVAGHSEAMVNAQLEYLGWLRKRLGYLPKRCPEEVLLSVKQPGSDFSEKSAAQVKEELRKALAGEAEVSGSDLIVLQKVEVAKIPADNPDLAEIRDRLRAWLHG